MQGGQGSFDFAQDDGEGTLGDGVAYVILSGARQGEVEGSLATTHKVAVPLMRAIKDPSTPAALCPAVPDRRRLGGGSLRLRTAHRAVRLTAQCSG